MKWRVRSNTTGKKIKPPKGKEFLLDNLGGVLVFEVGEYGKVSRLLTLDGYTVEFAFTTNEKGKWIYERCVLND